MRTLTSGNTLPDPYFPYGEWDFRLIRKSGQFFVDNTKHIRTLEKMGKHMILTRPPRWGKTLLHRMLAAYYDVKTTTEEFQMLFGDLDIGKDPTPLARTFHVLPIDLNIDPSERGAIRQDMFDAINGDIEEFALRYDLPDIKVNNRNAHASLKSLSRSVRRHNGQLYVMIDEYDRLANNLIAEPQKIGLRKKHPYSDVVAGQTGDPSSSPMRAFLETVKGIDRARTLITGITNITLADASGANVFESISLDKRLGSIVGFTEEDLRRGLAVLQLGHAMTESAMELLRTYFNGYRFPGVPDEKPLFVPQQCLFFLKGLQSGRFNWLLENDQWKAYDPFLLLSKIVDGNSSISQKVFHTLADSPITSRDVLELALRPVRCDVDSLSTTYRLEQMKRTVLRNETERQDSLNRTRAFMFAHGMVTLASGSATDTVELVVPNLMSRHLFLHNLDIFIDMRSVDIGCLFDMPSCFRVQQFLQSIVDRMQTLHDDNFAEVALQVELESFIRALILKSPRYRVVCEAKHRLFDGVAIKEGYSDLLLVDTHSDIAILLELQRVRLRDIPNQDSQTTRWNIGAKEKKIQDMSNDKIRSLEAIMHGKRQSIGAALEQKREQARRYVRSMSEDGYVTSSGETLVKKPTTKVFGFAVVQVGRRLLVTACQDDATELQ